MKKCREMIFGIHAITEAIMSGEQSVAKIWLKRTGRGVALKNLLALAQQNSIPYSSVPLEKLNRMTNGNHQGAIAYISPIQFLPLDTIIGLTYEKGKLPCVVVLDGLQDVRNVGAIARTAFATSVDALVINTSHGLPITADAVKASAGALLRLAVCRTHNLSQTLRQLQCSGLQLIACTVNAPKNIYQVDMTMPTAFIIGGEHKGIHPRHVVQCHQHIHIPMLGGIDSLNVSVATGVILYEYVRQNYLKYSFPFTMV